MSMPCEMCGKTAERLTKVSVEGTMLEVCSGCSKYGKQVRKPNYRRNSYRPKEAGPEVMVVSDFAQKIEKARQNKGIKQEDFAKQLNEKDSLIHKIETGHLKPSIALAKKIGRALGINLVEEIDESSMKLTKDDEDSEKKESKKPNRDSGVLTIADIIKFKKK